MYVTPHKVTKASKQWLSRVAVAGIIAVKTLPM
jgi:hypothetical protein